MEKEITVLHYTAPYKGESLEIIESRIQEGLTSYVEIGRGLQNIRENKLYNKTYQTFEEYCEKRWGFVGRTANLYIQASQVAENFEKNGMLTSPKDTPGYTQAVALTKLDPDQQVELAKTANFSEMTVDDIKEKVKKFLPPEVDVPLPTNQYAVGLCDCPWRYDFVATQNRAIENQYPTLPVEELCELPIKEVFPENAVLFFWATAPKLQEALQVLKAWGFEYKTHYIWDKEKIGMGHWARGRHELLLVATKGDVQTPEDSILYPSVMAEPRQGHSEKPQWAYEMIEKYYPTIKKIELFARKKRNGWDSWGTLENNDQI